MICDIRIDTRINQDGGTGQPEDVGEIGTFDQRMNKDVNGKY